MKSKPTSMAYAPTDRQVIKHHHHARIGASSPASAPPGASASSSPASPHDGRERPVTCSPPLISFSEDEALSDIVCTLENNVVLQQNSPEPSLVTADDETDNDQQKADERGNPAACIFVASLAKERSDSELSTSVWDHFQKWGALLDVKVLKDWMGRPYAFVQYARTQDAKLALKHAPGTILDGRSIRCEPARVNRTICLSSNDPIKKPLDEQQIHNELSLYGKIESFHMLDFPRGTRFIEQRAYIKYRYRDDAIRAFLTLHNYELNQNWHVDWAANLDPIAGPVTRHAKDISKRTSSTTDPTSIFIGNLSATVTEDLLRERFSAYGSIMYLRIIRKPFNASGTDHVRVFAFIKYKHHTHADHAIAEQDQTVWNGRQLRVAYREHSSSSSSSHHKRTKHPPHPPGMGLPAASLYPYVIAATGPAAHVLPADSNTSPDIQCNSRTDHQDVYDNDQADSNTREEPPSATHGGGGTNAACAPYAYPPYVAHMDLQAMTMAQDGNGMQTMYFPTGYYNYSVPPPYAVPIGYYPSPPPPPGGETRPSPSTVSVAATAGHSHAAAISSPAQPRTRNFASSYHNSNRPAYYVASTYYQPAMYPGAPVPLTPNPAGQRQPTLPKNRQVPEVAPPPNNSGSSSSSSNERDQ